jgi:hypothetical protein
VYKKGIFMTKSMLTAVASLLIANVVPADPPAPSLPEGDKYLATLTQDVDNVASARTLFNRCINENRPATETLKAANVLSGSYQHLCSDSADFNYWLKYWKESSSKPSDFSVAAQERMSELRSRADTLVLNGIHDVEDASKKPQYKDDQRMHEVARTMIAAYNAEHALKAEAEKK